METKLQKLINDIKNGNSLCYGKRQAWVSKRQYNDFEDACNKQGIGFVKTLEMQNRYGRRYRWYINSEETITYSHGIERIEVPVGDAVNPKNDYKFRLRIIINGKTYVRR